MEALYIYLHAFFLEDLAGKVNREAEGIIELKGVLAADDLDVIALHEVLQHLEALVNGLGKALLFHADHLGDEILFLLQLGIRSEVFADNGVADLVKEGLVITEQSAVTRGASEQTAQHIALALVGGHDAVADHKGGGTDVVGNNAQRNVGLLILAVPDARDFADVFHNILYGVHEEEVVHLLHNAGKTLQSHARINVGVLQGSVGSLAVAFKLGEHEVPHLNKAVALAADVTVGAAAALFGTAVKVDFGAGSAGT